MQCQTCGYSLLNLTGARCPECGEPFDLRDYQFDPGSVAFACPHCDHQHAGQGEAYLPADEDKAVCRACGRHMPLSAIRVVPLKDQIEAQPLKQSPWQRGRRLGYWRGWSQTCRLAMFQPGELAAMIGPDARPWAALCFALVNGMIVAVVWALVTGGVVLVIGGLSALLPNPDASARLAKLSVMLGEAGMVQAGAGFPLIIHMLLLAPVAHGVLLVTGDTAGGLSRTTAAVGYGHGPIMLCLIPAVGVPAGSIWIIVSCITLVSVTQKVALWRAAIACLILPAALVGLPMLFALYKLANAFG